MQTRHLHGNEAYNNSLVLKAGVLSIVYPDSGDPPSLRFHDGETPGGWEATSESVLILTPGDHTLQAGDYETGFVGEVPAQSLIDGESLAAEVGLSAGTPHNTDSPWLKYAVNGNVVYVAKQSLRYNMTFNQLQASDVVDGTQTITLGEFTYEVRLLSSDEWDGLLYPVHVDDPNGQEWGVDYTDEDLGIVEGNGRGTWTQTLADNDDAIFRGYTDLTSVSGVRQDYSTDVHGWRPVLILVGTSDLIFPLSTFTQYRTGLRAVHIYDWRYQTTG